MTRPSGPKKTRINLVVRETVREPIERLQEKTDADTMTEVIRRALDVYEMAVDDPASILPEAKAARRGPD